MFTDVVFSIVFATQTSRAAKKVLPRNYQWQSLWPRDVNRFSHSWQSDRNQSFSQEQLAIHRTRNRPKVILRRRIEVVGLLQSQGGTNEHHERRPTNFQLSHWRAGASMVPPYKNASPRQVKIIQPFLTLSHTPIPPAISDGIASKSELPHAADRFAGFSEPGPRLPRRFACRCGGNAICSWWLPILVSAAFCSAIALSSGWATCREIPAEAEITTTHASHLAVRQRRVLNF